MKVSLASPTVAADVWRIIAHTDLVEGLAGKHLLLTGSTGFFGKWLLATLTALNEKGAQIHVTALSRAPELFLADYPEYAACDWLDWLSGDVRFIRDWPVRQPVDLVLHAATDTLPAAHGNPLQIFDTILLGARNVLDLATSNGAKRILFTGSGAQYGAIEPHNPVLENAGRGCDSTLVSSAYGEAKRAQETLAALYSHQLGIEVVHTRCFAFSGPGLALDAHFAIGNFVRDALYADELVLNSDGQAVRSYLHGADLAGWLLTLLIRGESGSAYNIGSDHSLSIAELALQVTKTIAPHKGVRILGTSVPGQVRSYYVPDIGKARALGLEVWTDLGQSVRSMADWAAESTG